MSGCDLGTLDLVCRAMDSPLRPLDYALLLHFRQPPDGARLRKGALSARNLYPVTGSSIEGRKWRRLEAPEHGLTIAEAEGGNTDGAIREFLRVPFRLDREPPLRQLLIQGTNSPACLVTRVHHAAGDLLSTLMWIGHQLRAASGRDRFVENMAPFEPLGLRQSAVRASKSASAYRGRCHPIWTRNAVPSPERDWTTIGIGASELLELSRDRDGFTYNDVLIACALDTLHWWNTRHGAMGRKTGVWLPMNIREDPFRGFGNGTSRIRVYRRFAGGDTLQSKCRMIRSQIDWSRRHGEWAVPERHPLTRWPFAGSVPLLRGYLNRPWADTGSAALTHVQQWPGQNDDEFTDVVGMETIGALHARHALTMAAVTHSRQTWMTLTHDPALLGENDAAGIAQRLEHALSIAARDL